MVLKYAGKKSTIAVSAFAASALAPFAALADLTLKVAAPPAAPAGAPITTTQSIIDLAGKILFWVATIFWAVAVIFAFVAAFTYLRAAGSEEQLKKAHRYLIYTIVAMIVGVVAVALPAIVNSFLSGA